MIIKSFSRKSASFSQLLGYIKKGRSKGDSYLFTHNFYNETNHYKIVEQYLKNYRNLKKTNDKTNSLLHEVICLEKQENFTEKELHQIAKDLIAQYTLDRANNCLVTAGIHFHDGRVHIHFMLSSNELDNEKNLRLSHAEFEAKKAHIREYAKQQYPNLKQLPIPKKKKGDHQRKAKKVSDELQFKKRTGKVSDREIIRGKLGKIFYSAHSADEFIRCLREENLALYQRGKTFGFLDQKTGKKYRLKTLELESEFETLNARITQQEREKINMGIIEKMKQGVESVLHEVKNDTESFLRAENTPAQTRERDQNFAHTADQEAGQAWNNEVEREKYLRELQERREKKQKNKDKTKKRGISH